MAYRYETDKSGNYQLLQKLAANNRANPTEAESCLWKYLSGNKLGWHFRQQHPICGYIPDFVCLKAKLIVEVDGGYHLQGEQPEEDAKRTEYLNKEGFKVLRFSNEQVLLDTDNVINDIEDALEDFELSESSEPSSNLSVNSSFKSNQAPSLREGWGGCEVGRIGFGYDVHRLVPNRKLWLGGINIPFEKGLLGHSDADVLIHAICDALLGAANMRDIGYHFPDTSDETLNMDSKIILKKTIELIATKGYQVGNIDATICAERPKLNPHIPAMQDCLAKVIGCDVDAISIKATTTEKLGFTGRMEGISAYAVALIYPPHPSRREGV